jgi:hypothetical protein
MHMAYDREKAFCFIRYVFLIFLMIEVYCLIIGLIGSYHIKTISIDVKFIMVLMLAINFSFQVYCMVYNVKINRLIGFFYYGFLIFLYGLYVFLFSNKMGYYERLSYDMFAYPDINRIGKYILFTFLFLFFQHKKS